MEKLLSRQEAAELLGLAPQTLAKWAMTGKNLPVIKIGSRTVRYAYSDLTAFVEKCTAAGRYRDVDADLENELEQKGSDNA